MAKEKYIRKLSKKGKYSYYLVIPGALVEKLKWREKQKLEVDIYGKDKLIISDWEPKK